ncbi:T9SS type A sorting domain-containing protein [Candidatus Poribacteria bacterium]|nr:T9SS type A sorting domain-containing protein [Candidatus Poribacteria bacterium]
MLEEYPAGMLKTPGLKYLVRRLDGLLHPLHPQAAAIAWPDAGYIEFMEVAFKDTIHRSTTLPFIQRLVLHEKAHFLWAHLFDEQLKQDWIEIGGWYENPDDKDGWSTTKQVEFVSAYAHGKNPNEDMAESISYYIVDPDKLRSRSPAKYAFIRDRVMHGTRYISLIREDLTFQVYNLWPDYVYPGRIIGLDIQVEGAPEENKQITITLQLHGESDLDTAARGYTRIFSDKRIFTDVHFYPIDENGQQVAASHVLRGHLSLSKYAPNGYWAPDTISIGDANESERHSSQTDFGWKLYIDNPLADCEPPEYVPNSLRLLLSESETDRGERFQVVTARWRAIEASGIWEWSITINDEHSETYSITGGGRSWGENDAKMVAQKGEVEAEITIADYKQSGTYKVVALGMKDLAGNDGGMVFINSEESHTIEIQTRFPDTTPPELNVNTITVKAEPTNPEAPNGETRVEITFQARDDIAGYDSSRIHLRDPQGVRHGYSHYARDHGLVGNNMYFTGDPTVYRTYQEIVILPIGSPPGTWGLSDMSLHDKAENTRHVDFTEIVRFELIGIADAAILTSDVNNDGEVNIQDLVFVAANFGETGANAADVNADEIVDIRDLIEVAGALNPPAAAPALDPQILSMFTAADVEKWISEAQHLNLTDPTSQSGIRFLAQLLTTLMPKMTVLLPNYPNPFNPETWIPYQLSEPADVALTIYTTNGQIVRQMSLGHQSAGIYQSRMRAVYWDGRNAVGEPVASGIYFYTFTARDFTATRKMLIQK